MSEVKLEYQGVPIRIMEGPYIKHGKPTLQAVNDYQKHVQQLDTYRAFAAQELLELYNESWRDDEHPELTAKAFGQKLVSPSIQLFDEVGCASIYFRDSDMFGGHIIDVWIDKGQMKSAEISG